MNRILKWTLAVLAALVLFCLLSPLVFAKQLVESDLTDEGFTSLSVERRGLTTFGFDGFDKTGRRCTGTIRKGFLSGGTRDSACHTVTTDSDILKKAIRGMLGRANVRFGEIDCGDVKLEDTTAACDVAPVDGNGHHLTLRFAHEDSAWKLTGPNSVWEREGLEEDVRTKLTGKGHPVQTVDCGKGLLGAEVDQKLACTVTLDDAKVHHVEMTFGTTNYKWSSDLL